MSPIHSGWAAEITWGNSGTAWATDANWLGGVAPANDLTTDLAVFNSAAFGFQPNYGTRSVAGIKVGDGVTATGSLNLTGTILSLGAGGIQIAANSGTVTLNNSVRLGANQSWANNSSSLFTVGAAVSNVANLTPFVLTLNGSGSGGTAFTGVISNGGATGTTGLVVNTTGSGITTLSANNSFTGGVTLTAGILRATTSSNSLGQGTLSLGGGELQLVNDGATNFARATTVTGNTQITVDRTNSGAGVNHTLSTLNIGANTLTVAGGSNVTSGSMGLTFSGNTTLAGNAIFDVINPTGGGTTTLTMSGIVSGGSNGLTKTGNGTLILGGTNNANTYTGLTTVSGGELQLNKSNSGTNALAGNVTVGNGTLSLGNSNQIIDTATLTITAGGTFKLNARAETLAGISISSSGAVATIDLGNQVGSTALILNSNLTLGNNTALIGGGTLRRTGGNLTLNLDGGQVSGGLINVGINDGGTIINLTKNAGDGSGTLSLGNSGSTTTSTVNLNHAGVIDLGTKIVVQSNGSGSTANALNINIANTAAGVSGGIITTALLADISNPAGPNRIYNSANNQLTFAAGGAGFTLSGGVLDVRSMATTTTAGSITTNGNALTLSGGSLLGNRLVSTSGAITLSSGLLALRDIRSGTATNFTISTTDGNDGRTLKMLSGNTGTFSVANLAASTNYVAIGAQSSGGTWDRGTINAGQNYTITADTTGALAFGTAFATYTVAANSGLNGLAMGAIALPTQLFLGENSSFFVASSTAASRTYNVGADSGSNDVVVGGTGSFGFGINNTANAQIINLNRDKGAGNVTLLANGAHANNAINLAANQTGAGNLYVATRNLTLNSGVTFGGTGGIYTDLVSGDGIAQNILGGGMVSVAGSASVPIVFTINGTLNGVNTVSLNQDAATNAGTFVIGSTAVIGGTQTWWGAQLVGSSTSAFFSNNLTNPANWSGSIALGNAGSGGAFEASTNVSSPSSSSHYKFASLSLLPPGSAPTGSYRLVNSVQNDGGSGKEAFYTASFSVGGGIGDGSNGRYIFNLNGQDLWVDRFANVTGLQNRALVWQNDNLNSVSQIRAVDVVGDTFVSASFAVLNGATVEVVGGNYNALVYARNTGSIVADSAAVPNAPTSASDTTVKQTLAWDGTTQAVGGFTSFLGSGMDRGTNTNSNALGTNGTFRVIGGSYSTSGYILNPIGTVGTLDTTGTGDSILNDVLIRGNTASDPGGVGNSTTFPALVVAGTTNLIGNLVLENATGAANQATLRVGGVTASLTPSLSGTAVLNVTGNLTIGATNNLAIQSNGTVKVGGNVSIAGVGINLANNVTGLGVGIHSGSHFTLNGNQGAATPQTVNIVPTVGNFHVGDGADGILTGTAAQAVLAANLSAATHVDVNGADSRLSLGGYTLSIAAGNGQLTVGGMLLGNGTVNGDLAVIAGGTQGPGNSPGFQTVTGDASYAAGSTFAWELTQNVADDSILSGAAPFDQLQINGDLSITSGALFTLTLNGAGSTVDFTNAFWAGNQQWLVINVAGTGAGDFTLGAITTDSLGQSASGYGSFSLANTNGDIYLNWNAAVIPEPSSVSLLLVGSGLGLLIFRRRRGRVG